MCDLPVFDFVTGTMPWGSWSITPVLNFPCTTEGDLKTEAQPRPFLLLRSSSNHRLITPRLQTPHLHLADLDSPPSMGR